MLRVMLLALNSNDCIPTNMISDPDITRCLVPIRLKEKLLCGITIWICRYKPEEAIVTLKEINKKQPKNGSL